MGQTVASPVDPWLLNSRLSSSEGRMALAALVGRSPTDTNNLAAETGVFPSAGSPFALSSNGSAAAPRVSVGPGMCVVQTSAGGTYVCTWPAAGNLLFTAPAGNPRIDLVCARIQDTEADAGGSTQFTLITVDGTPASSPSAPATPAGYLKLWEVRVATDGTLTITDRRPYTRGAGGLRYCPAWETSRAGSGLGDCRILDNGQIDAWIGGQWRVVASPAVWSSFTPPLLYAGAGGQAAGSVNLGSNPTVSGRYIQIGKKVDLSYTWIFGSGTDGGSGDISTTLPPGMVLRAAAEMHIMAFLFTSTADSQLWSGSCYCVANSNKMQPRFPFALSDCRMGNYRVASSQGAAGTGIPLVAGGYPIGAGGVLTINGTVEIA